MSTLAVTPMLWDFWRLQRYSCDVTPVDTVDVLYHLHI